MGNYPSSVFSQIREDVQLLGGAESSELSSELQTRLLTNVDAVEAWCTQADGYAMLQSRIDSCKEEIMAGMISHSDVVSFESSVRTLSQLCTSIEPLLQTGDSYLPVVRALMLYVNDRESFLAEYGSMSDFIAHRVIPEHFQGLCALDVANILLQVSLKDELTNVTKSFDKLTTLATRVSDAVSSVQAAALNLEQRYKEAVIESASLNGQIKNSTDLALAMREATESLKVNLPVLEATVAAVQTGLKNDQDLKRALEHLAANAPSVANATRDLLAAKEKTVPLETFATVANGFKSLLESLSAAKSFDRPSKL